MTELVKNHLYRLGAKTREVQSLDGDGDGMVFALLDEEAFVRLRGKERPDLPPAKREGERSRRLTRVETYEDYLLCAIRVPMRRENLRGYAFVKFVICRDAFLVIAENQEAEQFFCHFSLPEGRKKTGLSQVAHDCLEYLIKEDLLFLEEMEGRITRLEESALKESQEEFNHKMTEIRRELLYLHNYYDQLLDLTAALEENENEYFADIRPLKQLSGRVARLHDYTQMLREYSMQVREIYQTQIDVKQNQIMKFLTGVATIFMPLTLITGWFGMNFRHMPELEWRYGYPAVLVVSVLLIVFLIWYFKKKKYF